MVPALMHLMAWHLSQKQTGKALSLAEVKWVLLTVCCSLFYGFVCH